MIDNTPEVLLVKTYVEKKQLFLQSVRAEYSNQQADYTITEQFDFIAYEADLPEFTNQAQYDSKIGERGSFRKKHSFLSASVKLMRIS